MGAESGSGGGGGVSETNINYMTRITFTRKWLKELNPTKWQCKKPALLSV